MTDLSWLQENDFTRLGLALLLGMIIGVQRGWVQREEQTGHRIAGVRTYSLISLFGGVSALLTQTWGVAVLIVNVVALTSILVAAYLTSQRMRLDMSITSAMASLLTFCFGAMAVLGHVELAAAATVVTAVVLDFKAELHGLLQRLREQELDAGLKLLLITVVMLPILPNHGYGPGGAINPYEIWWMVVLIASVSFVGYFAVKLGGASKGILFTSLFAGLSSSTALTLHYSRLSKQNPALSALMAAGVLAACGTMFPRVLLICSLINPALAESLLWPILAMTLATYIPAIVIWLRNAHVPVEQPELTQNPLELKAAFFFGILLLFILLMSQLLKSWFGDTGIYALAAVSGISDVDAISLSLSRLSTEDILPSVAVSAIVIAACVNSLVKAILTLSIGTQKLSRRVASTLVATVLVGLLVVVLLR